MIFLIEYDRQRGQIVSFSTFADSDRPKASNARLELELIRNAERADSEIVLLEAASEAALRQTHRRYFQNTREIIESST